MTDTTAVTTTIIVDAPVDRAFSVFTDDMGAGGRPSTTFCRRRWRPWSSSRRWAGTSMTSGRTGASASGRASSATSPRSRVVFSWDISLQWQIETDPGRTSEVEVRFLPEGEGRTRVELEHRHLDRHGDGWEGMRDAVGSPEGWGIGLQRFARHVEHAGRLMTPARRRVFRLSRTRRSGCRAWAGRPCRAP